MVSGVTRGLFFSRSACSGRNYVICISCTPHFVNATPMWNFTAMFPFFRLKYIAFTILHVCKCAFYVPLFIPVRGDVFEKLQKLICILVLIHTYFQSIPMWIPFGAPINNGRHTNCYIYRWYIGFHMWKHCRLYWILAEISPVYEAKRAITQAP